MGEEEINIACSVLKHNATSLIKYYSKYNYELGW